MIHVIFEKSDGNTIKGLTDCPTPSPNTKQMVDGNLLHGSLSPGQTSTPQLVNIKTFSWSTNGDPLYPITNCGLFLSEYYNTDPVYLPDAGKTYCDGAASATFGDYTDENGSHSPSHDLTYLQTWGDAGTGGVQVSVDRGRTYQTFTSSAGTISNPINLAATAMDIGVVNGQLNPGDIATIYLKIKVPDTFTDPTKEGVWLFNLGLFYSYTE